MIDYDHGWDAEWDDMRRFGPCSRHHRRIVQRMLAGLEVSSILDAGCGPGTTLLDLRARFPGAAFHGVDVSESAIRMARERIPDGTFEVLDVQKEALDARFDLVLCLDVIEHLPDDRAAIANVAAMTGRHALFSTLQGRMRRSEAAVGHLRNYRKGEVEACLREVGLVPERVVEWGWPMYSPLYRDLLEHLPKGQVTGRFGPLQKLSCHAMYAALALSSHRRGDYVFVLASRPAESA